MRSKLSVSLPCSICGQYFFNKGFYCKICLDSKQTKQVFKDWCIFCNKGLTEEEYIKAKTTGLHLCNRCQEWRS